MPLLLARTIVIIRLVEQEVRRELLVLVTGEICLNSLILCEPKAYQTFNGIALLLRDRDLVDSGRQWGIFISSRLAEKAEELLRVLCDELSELRVTGTELLKNWLEHLGLLLDYLTELLELGIVT